jgi:hypothetical protein
MADTFTCLRVNPIPQFRYYMEHEVAHVISLCQKRELLLWKYKQSYSMRRDNI